MDPKIMSRKQAEIFQPFLVEKEEMCPRVQNQKLWAIVLGTNTEL